MLLDDLHVCHIHGRLQMLRRLGATFGHARSLSLLLALLMALLLPLLPLLSPLS
ncbi:hypothetical protein KZ686_17575 [Cupriavidus cauae]|uniref:hypothetical protein n=1 Tax=Cupriavidus cauae TaxID=2608999 RepID=UPI0022439C7D|nr:hypothetical protein [Cupriavidus cauae]UZN52670.1 hypothetical protein KZ686_17575 [Cupriavidus cauae]